MTKRRDFIKKSVLGTTGIAIGSMGLSCSSSVSSPPVDELSQKDWHTDAEWSRIKYGDWGGPGVSAGPGPMDEILLKDYAPRSTVVTKETFVQKAKFPAIDSHVHKLATTPGEVEDWIKTMDEVGIEKSIVLTQATGEAFDANVDLFLKKHSGRFALYCGMDLTDIESDDYPDRTVAELQRCYNSGARGVGELSDKGWGFTGNKNLPRNKRLHPDDQRLNSFWKKCAELKMPVSLHVADHPSCWTPLDVFQERSPDYQHFNQSDNDVPSFGELIDIRNRTLESNPHTIFIACHLGNQGHDLELLSQTMDKYPNLYLDISARDYEIGRTPRSSARFLTLYKDRILFGTDQGREKSMYQMHWRLLETADEYIVGRVGWRYYGLELTEQVLQAIYSSVANRIFNFG